MDEGRGNRWALALILVVLLGVGWFMADALFGITADGEDQPSLSQTETEAGDQTPSPWLTPDAHVGEPVEARVTIPAAVSDRVVWMRPPGADKPVLAFAPNGNLGEGQSLQLHGTVVRPATIISSRDLSPQERHALDKEMAVILVIEAEKPSEPEPEELNIGDVRLNPQAYYGRSISGVARVDRVLSDRDVWVLEQDGNTMFGLLNQSEVPLPGSAANVQGSVIKIRGQVLNPTPEPGQSLGALDRQPGITQQPAYLFINEYEVVER